MKLTLFEITTANGTLPVPMYGLMVLLGFCAAFIYVHFRAKKIGIEPDTLLPLYIVAPLTGLPAAHLLYAMVVDWDALFSFGGFAFYGGAIGVAIAARFLKLPMWAFADIAIPSLILGLGIGRMGCFFAGCCHGAPAPEHLHATPILPEGFLDGQIWLSSHFPFVYLEFYEGMSRYLNQLLYPTQLLSVVAALSVFLFLAIAWSRRAFDGQITGMALIIEPIFRVMIEGYRADHRGVLLHLPTQFLGIDLVSLAPGMSIAGENGDMSFGLTTSQTIGLVMILLGVVILAWRRGQGKIAQTKEEKVSENKKELWGA